MKWRLNLVHLYFHSRLGMFNENDFFITWGFYDRCSSNIFFSSNLEIDESVLYLLSRERKKKEFVFLFAPLVLINYNAIDMATFSSLLSPHLQDLIDLMICFPYFSLFRLKKENLFDFFFLYGSTFFSLIISVSSPCIFFSSALLYLV